MSSSNEFAIECANLGRVYTSRSLFGPKREVVALSEVSIQIPAGLVFGLLGPNGAGKTTTVRILATLLTPTTGTARVLGYDVVRQAGQVRRNIGFILGGDRGLYGRLTGKQNLRYFGALNHMNPGEANRRADELLARVGLTEAGNAPVEGYSRGMRQRLHIARGLLTDPSVLFMDEPTIGLDPMAAQELRQYIPELTGQGKTILLTTHYMLEADLLSDTIAIIDKGRLIATGTPTEIKRNFSQISIIEVTVRETRERLIQEICAIEGVERADAGADGAFQKLVVYTKPGTDLKDRIVETVDEANVENVVARDPTLEEAYVNILR